MLTKIYTVKIKEEGLQGFMKSLGVNSIEEYEVVGTIGDKLLLEINNGFLEIYPRHVTIVNSVNY
jgi:hypothetical protein